MKKISVHKYVYITRTIPVFNDGYIADKKLRVISVGRTSKYAQENICNYYILKIQL